MEEERWLRVEDWLLNHLAAVQDLAFIIMPRDLAAYEELLFVSRVSIRTRHC